MHEPPGSGGPRERCTRGRHRWRALKSQGACYCGPEYGVNPYPRFAWSPKGRPPPELPALAFAELVPAGAGAAGIFIGIRYLRLKVSTITSRDGGEVYSHEPFRVERALFCRLDRDVTLADGLIPSRVRVARGRSVRLCIERETHPKKPSGSRQQWGFVPGAMSVLARILTQGSAETRTAGREVPRPLLPRVAVELETWTSTVACGWLRPAQEGL